MVARAIDRPWVIENFVFVVSVEVKRAIVARRRREMLRMSSVFVMPVERSRIALSH
jgi:hypothetical protein